MIQRNGSSHIRQVGGIQSWAAMLGGGALAVYGATRRNVSGAALAATGGYLLIRGVRGARHHFEPLHIERSITINKPVEEVFQFWRNFENLPRFMYHLQSVRTTGDRWSHWEARAPAGMSVGWDAEIVDEKPNSYIVWRSTPTSDIVNNGSVEFRPDRYHGGTQLTVALDYQPPAGKFGAVFARMFGEHPEQQIREDLRHMKMLLEAGEIATVNGQTSGRRTPWVRMVQAAAQEEERRGRTPQLTRSTA